MKVQKTECPYCGGILQIRSQNEPQFCSYCGRPLAFTNSRTININQNIRIERNEKTNRTDHVINEAKIERERRLATQAKMDLIETCVLLGVALFMFFYGMSQL